jgi:hypothetical protein
VSGEAHRGHNVGVVADPSDEGPDARERRQSGTYRLKSLAAELRFRRRRLDVYRRSPDWPGKATALTFELLNYDRRLVIAAHMLDVASP